MQQEHTPLNQALHALVNALKTPRDTDEKRKTVVALKYEFINLLFDNFRTQVHSSDSWQGSFAENNFITPNKPKLEAYFKPDDVSLFKFLGQFKETLSEFANVIRADQSLFSPKNFFRTISEFVLSEETASSLFGTHLLSLVINYRDKVIPALQNQTIHLESDFHDIDENNSPREFTAVEHGGTGVEPIKLETDATSELKAPSIASVATPPTGLEQNHPESIQGESSVLKWPYTLADIAPEAFEVNEPTGLRSILARLLINQRSQPTLDCSKLSDLERHLKLTDIILDQPKNYVPEQEKDFIRLFGLTAVGEKPSRRDSLTRAIKVKLGSLTIFDQENQSNASHLEKWKLSPTREKLKLSDISLRALINDPNFYASLGSMIVISGIDLSPKAQCQSLLVSQRERQKVLAALIISNRILESQREEENSLQSTSSEGIEAKPSTLEMRK